MREDLNLAVAMRWPTRRGKRERNKKKEEESLVSQMANISRMNAHNYYIGGRDNYLFAHFINHAPKGR